MVKPIFTGYENVLLWKTFQVYFSCFVLCLGFLLLVILLDQLGLAWELNAGRSCDKVLMLILFWLSQA